MSSKGEDRSFVLSSSQVMSLITSTIIGVGVLTLPRSVTATAHQSGWIPVILGGLISAAALWLILRFGRMFPGRSLLAAGVLTVGSSKNKWAGKILIFPLAFCFVLYWVVSTASTARTFGEVVVTAVLVKTPLEVTVGTMLFVAFLMVTYNLEVMARVNEVLLPIIIIPVIFIALLSFQSAHFNRLLPLFYVDWTGIFKGILAGAFAYQGFELIALFTGNMHINSKQTTRAAMLGIAVPTLVYTMIAVAGISAFGYEELQKLMWPTLELVKTTEVPGLILERLESAFLGVLVAAVFTTTGNIYFAFCWLIKEMFGLRHHRYIAVAALPVLYYLAMWPRNVHLLFDYLQYIGYLGMALSLVSPALLLAIGWIRKNGSARNGGADPGGRKN